MAQFDVYILGDGQTVVDCQADHFAGITTRMVVPLEDIGRSHKPQPRLNPILDVNGKRMVLLVQFATAVRTTELRVPIASLAAERLQIVGAFDMLLTGV